ncbi:hypothetical protein C900_04253 [Fulvivirga imtechensis AK7]|uniref:Uncharacterized protein n=1 Tax=Fulvivirga imtechensis AK7 TaxID=1237149 RepID=L8JWH7_9BACT|nr:hypothetical protein C900_04253 [Fulvivirga imtechensis AK7]
MCKRLHVNIKLAAIYSIGKFNLLNRQFNFRFVNLSIYTKKYRSLGISFIV